MLADKLDTELARLDQILYRRGAFFEDEAALHSAYTNVKQWMADDKAETERIEIEAAAAAEVEAEERRISDPNYRTRELFKNTKVTIPRKER